MDAVIAEDLERPFVGSQLWPRQVAVEDLAHHRMVDDTTKPAFLALDL